MGTEVPGTSLLSHIRLAAPRGQEKVESKVGMLMFRKAGRPQRAPLEVPGWTDTLDQGVPEVVPLCLQMLRTGSKLSTAQKSSPLTLEFLSLLRAPSRLSTYPCYPVPVAAAVLTLFSSLGSIAQSHVGWQGGFKGSCHQGDEAKMGQQSRGRPLRSHQYTALVHTLDQALTLLSSVHQGTSVGPLHSWGLSLCPRRVATVAGTLEVRERAQLC